MRRLLPLFALLMVLPLGARFIPGLEGRAPEKGVVFEEFPVRHGSLQEFPTTKGVEYWYILDDGDPDYYCGRPTVGDTLGTWFMPVAKGCILSAAYAIYYENKAVVEVYMTKVKSDFDPGNYGWSNQPGTSPGPRPIPPCSLFVFGPYETTILQSAGWDIFDFLAVVGDTWALDVQDTIFVVGYIITGAGESPYDPPIFGDASFTGHDLVYLQNPGASGNPPGWYYYYSGGSFMMRAKAYLYTNPPPMITMEKKADTYLTTPITISAIIEDIGVPPDSAGVAWARLYWMFNQDTSAIDSVDLTLVSGDATYGVYEGAIPPGNVGDTITYWIKAGDIQGNVVLPDYTPEWTYVIRAPTPGADVVFFIGDNYYGDYTPDAVSMVYYPYDVWYPEEYHGLPDSSVIFSYPTIFWVSWGGEGIEEIEDNLRNFLDNGGNFFYSDQDGAYPFVGTYDDTTIDAGNFLYDYLHLTEVYDDFMPGDSLQAVNEIYGVSGDPISDPWSDTATYVAPYIDISYWLNYAGMMVTDGSPTENFIYLTGETNGMYYEDATAGYKTVFLFWPFWYMMTEDTSFDVDAQKTLIINVLKYLGHAASPDITILTSPPTTCMAPPHLVSASVSVTDSASAIDSVVLSWTQGSNTGRAVMTDVGGGVYEGEITGVNPSWTDPVNFAVEAYTDLGGYRKVEGYYYYLAPTANILYVNDTYPDLPYSFDYSTALANNGYAFDYYDVETYGVPDSTVFTKANYDVIVWNADMGWTSILAQATSDNLLSGFLNDGGHLLLTSDELLGVWTGWTDGAFGPGDFIYDYFGVNYVYNDIGLDTLIPANDPWNIGSSNLDWAPWWYDFTDAVGLDASAPAVSDTIYLDGSGNIVGIGIETGTYKAVFYPFAVAYLTSESQDTLIARTLAFLQGVPQKKSAKFFLSRSMITRDDAVIRFGIPTAGHVTLKLYDVTGRVVRTLVDADLAAGVHQVKINAKRLPAGVYFYRLDTGKRSATEKLIVVH
ncbi:hypothetical protein DRQ18_05105 [bacterium]|nr:MAG: hypothetical protein DRQ18_05105 [bacterium]